jgi:hypothetical protein
MKPWALTQMCAAAACLRRCCAARPLQQELATLGAQLCGVLERRACRCARAAPALTRLVTR